MDARTDGKGASECSVLQEQLSDVHFSPPKKQASGHSTNRGVLARYLELCLDEKLAKASCAEADISYPLLAEAYVNLRLMQVEIAEEFAELGVSRFARGTALEAQDAPSLHGAEGTKSL